VPKYTLLERELVKNIVANLSIKRIPGPEIVENVFNQTGKTLSRSGLYNIKQSIKKDSYHWYKTLKQGEYEYIHEFKERINEIVDLQKRHYKIIEDNANNPSVQQTSLAELHKLNITLSNYFDVAPSIGNATISETPKTERRSTSTRTLSSSSNFHILRDKPFWIWTRMNIRHNIYKQKVNAALTILLAYQSKRRKNIPYMIMNNCYSTTSLPIIRALRINISGS